MTRIINQSSVINYIPIDFHSKSPSWSPLWFFDAIPFAEAQDRQIPNRRWHGHDVDAANLLAGEKAGRKALKTPLVFASKDGMKNEASHFFWASQVSQECVESCLQETR